MPKTSWKGVPQLWAGSRETSVSEVAVGPLDDTSPRVGRTQLTEQKGRTQICVWNRLAVLITHERNRRDEDSIA